MAEPGERWDGRKWLSADGLWAWNGTQWLQYGSNLHIAARVAIYAAIGLAINLPILWVLALFWGLEGPGWAASPPDVIASIVQIALTLAGALVAFCAGWLLVRIDRRDWWLGGVFAWPWIASATVFGVGSLVSHPLDTTGIVISACMLVFTGFPLAGSMLGRLSRWTLSRRPRSARPSSEWFGRATRTGLIFLVALVRSALDASTGHSSGD